MQAQHGKWDIAFRSDLHCPYDETRAMVIEEYLLVMNGYVGTLTTHPNAKVWRATGAKRLGGALTRPWLAVSLWIRGVMYHCIRAYASMQHHKPERIHFIKDGDGVLRQMSDGGRWG